MSQNSNGSFCALVVNEETRAAVSAGRAIKGRSECEMQCATVSTGFAVVLRHAVIARQGCLWSYLNPCRLYMHIGQEDAVQ